jgi:very-short-patch-repair endonuclease/DNA polymerase III delta prime subunit
MSFSDNALSIDEKLRRSRLELLDIGLRNNLVSFRKTSKSLTIQGCRASELLKVLLEDQKSLAFEATGKRNQSASSIGKSDANDAVLETELFEVLSTQDGTADGMALDDALAPGSLNAARSAQGAKRAGATLQAALTPESLFIQLLKMRSEAQTFVEEQGANLLFLAIGFLHWYEADTAQEARCAPLVLVPCALTREGTSQRFELEPTGDDVVINLSLVAKLKADFGIALPVPDDGADSAEADWLGYLEQVAQAIAVQKRWKVAPDETVLGFFSFGKFLMFKDLDPETWPKEKQPGKHPVVGRLMGEGFGGESPAYEDDVHVDEAISPGDVHFVKDADSSQTQAILEVREGRNLVIQGPPGTGKSQTITNLIAELIGQNKSVLFVAEKMAALEVVKRRLDECHLGDAVLELHSHRATKVAVLKELSRTLDQGRPLNEGGEREIEQLRKVQSELNIYCTAVAATVGRSGLDFAVVLGRLLKTQRLSPALAPLPWEAIAQWSMQDYDRAHELAQNMALLLAAMGQPKESAFWGSTHKAFTPIEENQASLAIAQGQAALNLLQESAAQLSERLRLTAAVSLQDIDVVCRAARRAAQAPKLDGVQLTTQDWQLRRDAIKALITAGSGLMALRRQFGGQLIDAAWEQDVLPIRQAILQYGNKWWKMFSGEWRAAKKRLGALVRADSPSDTSQMLAKVDGVLAYQQHKKNYDTHATLGQALFGAQWQAEQSDWDVLERLNSWVVALHDEVGKGQMPQAIVDFLAGHTDASGLGDMANSTEANVLKLKAALEATTSALGIAPITQDTKGSTFANAGLDDLALTLDAWRRQLPQLHQLARFNALAQQFDQAQLQPLLQAAQECTDAETFVPLLELSWYSNLVRQAYHAQPVLAQFDRLEHEHRIKRFKELDFASIQHAQTKLAKQVWERKPNINQPGEMAVIRHEINKKRRHLPIRQLMERAGRAIQQFKPVFMMSPMSIANFLPPGKLEFDVVIFDEASQVKAVDALGAIMRGQQVIVVGDTRQMPPTDFFSREIEQEEDTATGDLESILSMFKAMGCNERYLRWHYRSRHESLIAVSNAEFYDSKLVVFPTSGANADATGIALEYLPEALYDRGRTRTNKGEAQAVAKAVIAHAINRPKMSLGVAAFSVAQRDLIEVEIELMRRKHPEAEGFFASHPHEPFFVKNLENIQGDERDTIFISIGYGRNESGKIAKEFGPLNRDGGHRRLNVLITRAKMAMRIFSNFRGDELELDASSKHGVRALKNLLKYAETRELEVSVETGKAADSPFEDQVLTALREHGYQLEPQVGTAGYFIDMAVRDPDMPGRYVLAIECDGAAYHSSRSARDRDRLRQGVLEGLGWRFHRIWSTDWFRNAAQETQRAIDAIEAARQALSAGKGTADPMSLPTAAGAEPVKRKLEREVPREETHPSYSTVYQTALVVCPVGVELLNAPVQALASMVQEVVRVEAPVNTAIIIRRVVDAFGIGRAGSRIASRLEQVIAQCVREHGWTLHEGFLMAHEYRDGFSSVPIRDRSMLPAAERKIELVSPPEIRAALLRTVELAFSIDAAAAVSEVAQLLGFGRASSKIAAEIQQQLDYLIQAGEVFSDKETRLSRLVKAVA